MAIATQQSAAGGGGSAGEASLAAVLSEIREMRAEMRDMRAYVERVEAKANARQQDLHADVNYVKDLAEAIKENVAGLTVNIAKIKSDLSGKMDSVRTKVGSIAKEVGSVAKEVGVIAKEVDGVGEKFDDMGAKLGDLQADFVQVKVHVDGVSDGNKGIKSTMRKMQDAIGGIGERMDVGFNKMDTEWRSRKKRRLDNSTSENGDDDQRKKTGTNERIGTEDAVRRGEQTVGVVGGNARIGNTGTEEAQVYKPPSQCLTQTAALYLRNVYVNNGKGHVDQLFIRSTRLLPHSTGRKFKIDSAINLDKHGERAWFVEVVSPVRNPKYGGVFSSLCVADARAKELVEEARDEHDVVLVRPCYVNCFPNVAPKLIGLRRE